LETRNIGVFVRFNDHWRSRFLGESDGKLDLRRVRGVVEHTGAYEQWVSYWRHLVASSRPEDVPKALIDSSKVNFVVCEGAAVFLAPDAVGTEERTLDHMFYLVVGEFPEQRSEELNLSQIVEEKIRRYGLRTNPHFRESPAVKIELGGGAFEHVRPSFSYVNGTQQYFQKVAINPLRPEITQREVHNAAWIFEKLRTIADRLETNDLVKVVTHVGELNQIPPTTPEYLNLLNTLSHVINVDDEPALDRKFAALAQ